MFRTLFAVVLVYAYGHPGFDGHRPTPFDKPVQGFYDGVNGAANDSARAFAILNDARTMRYLDILTARLGNDLHAL
jgi:hypothetical protein